MRKQVPMKSSRFSLSLKREKGGWQKRKKIRGKERKRTRERKNDGRGKRRSNITLLEQ